MMLSASMKQDLDMMSRCQSKLGLLEWPMLTAL